jgi:hypothetical protein
MNHLLSVEIHTPRASRNAVLQMHGEPLLRQSVSSANFGVLRTYCCIVLVLKAYRLRYDPQPDCLTESTVRWQGTWENLAIDGLNRLNLVAVFILASSLRMELVHDEHDHPYSTNYQGGITMTCTRCSGLMVEDHLLDMKESYVPMWMRGLRCVACGNIEDPLIHYNRMMHEARRISRRASRVVQTLAAPAQAA